MFGHLVPDWDAVLGDRRVCKRCGQLADVVSGGGL